MENSIKKFIEDNIGLIEENRWGEVYALLDESSCAGTAVGYFTNYINDAGIDPLEYLDFIPSYYLQKNIEEYHIPNHIRKLEQFALYHCTLLERLYIPLSIEVLNFMSVYYCIKLKDIYYEGTKEQWENLNTFTDWLSNKEYIIHCKDGDILPTIKTKN